MFGLGLFAAAGELLFDELLFPVSLQDLASVAMLQS